MKSEQGNNRPDPIPQAVCADPECTNRLIYDQEEDWGLCQEHTLIKRRNEPIKVFNHPVLVSLVVKTSSEDIRTADILDELHFRTLIAEQDNQETVTWTSGEPTETILVPDTNLTSP